MELECKRKDGSWHPCRISLSEDNAAIIVAYENSGEEEEEVQVEEEEKIESKQEGLARLRFRSAFLQGGECSQLIEGQRVLALHDASSSNLFFDAIVEKINRVRHSDRLACRCTFSLHWLTNYAQDQKVRVTSACIMQLSDKSIETHPVFEAFKAPTNLSAKNGALAFSENLFDVDLNDSLENQVENIIMDQGADCLKDAILGLRKVNKKGLKNKKSSVPNSDRRVTMNKSKQEIEFPLGEAIKRASGNSFLSPLAARAALASVICTLPASALSKQLEEFPVFPETSKADVGFPFFSPLSARTNLTSCGSAFPVNGLPKQAKEPPLTPNRLDYNSDTGRRVGVNLGSEKMDPVIPRRITRSAKKQEVIDLTDMQETQNQKSRGTRKCKRESENCSFTTTEDAVRSASTENKQRIFMSPFASAAASASIVTNTISDCEENVLPKQAKKPPLRPNQSGYISDSGRTVRVKPISEKVDPFIPRRITRSAVKREGVNMMTGMQGTQNEKSRGTEKDNKKLGNSSFTPDVNDIATPVMSENKKRICISPIASSTTSASIVTNTISDCEGKTYQDAESQTVAKRTKTVLRKPPTRFSVRLAQLDNDISQTNK